MPVRSDFGYAAEIRLQPEGDPTAVLELDAVDFEPALQFAYFQTVRAGTRSPVARCLHGTVEPVFDEVLGPPAVAAFRVQPAGRRRAPAASSEIPTRYLRPAVEAAAANLVRTGRLTAGDLFRFRIVAHPRRAENTLASGGVGVGAWDANDVQVEAIPQPLAIQEGSLARLLERSAERDRAHADPVDLPVLVSAEVLEQTAALARVAPELETGGVLLGVLRRDSGTRALFLEISAFLPARHAISRPDRLTFTHETWADARAAIAMRAGGEDWVGWFHSHPFFCRACPPEARRQCVFTHPFLSEHDRSLHRTVFGRPFDVALLLTDKGPEGQQYALFGWRRGMLERRSFHVMGEPVATEPRHACGERDADAPV